MRSSKPIMIPTRTKSNLTTSPSCLRADKARQSRRSPSVEPGRSYPSQGRPLSSGSLGHEACQRHPIRDSLKLLGVGILVAASLLLVAFLQMKYDVRFARFRRYLPAPNPRLGLLVFVGLLILAVAGSRLLSRLLLFWHERRAKREKQSDPRSTCSGIGVDFG